MSRSDDTATRQVMLLERELAQARLALEEFTFSVSHDLRAQLRHVNAYLRIVREDLGEGLDPAIARHLDTAAGAGAQMGKLMDGLMELSRIGRAELQPDEVDMGRLIGEIRHQLELQDQERDIQWTIAPDLPHVQGDMAMLGQMLSSLLGNAIKFTRPRPDAQIEIGWSPLDDVLCELWFRDNGVGFDPRMQNRLFRVFQTLHSAREFGGIGIGLALARRVVERHGGSIRAEGETGKGCCIRLSLPLA